MGLHSLKNKSTQKTWNVCDWLKKNSFWRIHDDKLSPKLHPTISEFQFDWSFISIPQPGFLASNFAMEVQDKLLISVQNTLDDHNEKDFVKKL